LKLAAAYMYFKTTSKIEIFYTSENVYMLFQTKAASILHRGLVYINIHQS